MTAVDTPREPSSNDVDIEFNILTETLARSRRWKNRIATVLMVASFLLAAIPLLLVLIVVVQKGFSVVASADWFTKDIPTDIASNALASKFGAKPKPIVYGMQPAIIGTIYIV